MFPYHRSKGARLATERRRQAERPAAPPSVPPLAALERERRAVDDLLTLLRAMRGGTARGVATRERLIRSATVERARLTRDIERETTTTTTTTDHHRRTSWTT